MFYTILTTIIVATIMSISTFIVQERKLRTELRTKFMAKQASNKLLESPKWKKRSFNEIKTRLVGFDDNGLHKILDRSGAIRFEGEEGRELWGLISPNIDDL